MKKTQILLVDDHQIMLDGLQAFLEREPELEVAGMASSGEEALEFLNQQKVDLVILDVRMPEGMDGLELARQIRRQDARQRIILLTMMGEWKYVNKAFSLGINGFVIKDKSKESLVSGIHAVMKGHRYYPPDLPTPGPDDLGLEEEEEVHLTRREKEIICLMAENPDCTSKDLAEILYISPLTVERHQQNAKKKLNFSRNTQLIIYALKNGLCDD